MGVQPTKENIAKEIITNAVTAAIDDPRFPPMQLNELKNLQISVDILEKPEPISSIKKLNPEKYGIIVKSGLKTGLLLPNL